MVLPNQVHLKLYYYYYQVAMAVTPSASGYFFFPSFLDMRWMTFEQASKGEAVHQRIPSQIVSARASQLIGLGNGRVEI
jgi:hypothetical protein